VVAADIERAASGVTDAERAPRAVTDVEQAPRAVTDRERAPRAVTDVEQASRAVTDRERAPRAVTTGDGDRFEVATVWRLMAERTQRSWQEVPQFVLRREVYASRLESWKAAARHRPGCERVTHTDLLVKVCAEALRRHPRANASWREGAIIPGPGINIAVAIATDDGLVAPVVHRADQLDLAAIAARRAELAEAARTRRLRPEDLRDGTFTISNLGMYGVDSFQAIVDAPQAAILAVGRARERPVALDGAVVVRPVVALSVSFDHRVVDGARGAEFLDTIASLVEEPAGLLA
jgi:pyruvate dehydrogenase E2 component (dihydrolipoamide acetyltransferase)